LADILELKTSERFSGRIWNTLADPTSGKLFIEVRDVQKKQVSFSALNLQNNMWFWKDVTLEESWWVTLAAIAGNTLLFTLYTDTNNPDKKSLLAYDILTKQMAWWQNAFTLSVANGQYVRGVDARFPGREITLDALQGKPLADGDYDLGIIQNFNLIRPFQYEEGSGHFQTVSHFLKMRLGIQPVATVEYLESHSLIIVSVFVSEEDLANYLYVFDAEGEIVLREKLGERLKGIGLDTFFIFSDHLIFVKNTHELIVYKIV
jgi:hypothetical protein